MISVPPLSCTSGLNPDEVVARVAGLARTGQLRSFGTFTTAIYDTAWMSMVCKHVDGRLVWCFPQCFHHILEEQQPDGTWPAYATTVDGVLNTSASLLSMLKHRSLCDNTIIQPDELEARIEKAQNGLRGLLQQWSVENTDHVGFEILVPSVLQQIAAFGLQFDFPDKRQLQVLHDRKIKRFRPEMVYAGVQTTLLHSLEGLIGLIDFDKVSHHCSSDIGLLGSPSSTAAYLMNCSTWDERAESYLRHALAASGGHAVSSAFPTGVFEISWALSILLDKSIGSKTLDQDDIDVLATFFTNLLNLQQGVVGFAPKALEDADDTARAILTLRRLGRHPDCSSMVDIFEADQHFRTYKLEQNPSPSANCNVLLALLECESVDTYSSQIGKIVEYLVSLWEEGKMADKWNLSVHYVSMLLSEALVRLMKVYDAGNLQQLPAQLVTQRVPLVISHLLTDTLMKQQRDGSWQSSTEITSYCVIMIAHCLSLPWSPSLKQQLTQALERGRQFVVSNVNEDDPAEPERLWIEKVTYASVFLHSTYIVAALHIECELPEWSETTIGMFAIPEKHARKATYLLSKLPLFQERPLICSNLALVQASHYAARLRSARLCVFPRDQMPVTSDKYLEFVPVLWTAANQVGSQTLPPSVMWEMLLASMLIYQVDEYMESVVANLSEEDVEHLTLCIAKACGLHHDGACKTSSMSVYSTQYNPSQQSCSPRSPFSVREVVASTLVSFINFIRGHESMTRASDATKRDLSIELHDFLLAHIAQNDDNRQLKYRESMTATKNGQTCIGLNYTYSTWVHTTGANTTSCPMAFRFFTCLIESNAVSCAVSDCLRAPAVKYCMDTMARHLAVMCRQYNDLGSVDRDKEEKNLNSLDFPMFRPEANGEHGDRYPTQRAKDDLMQLCDIERSMVGLALQKLREMPNMNARTMMQIQAFVDVTDLFGQLYLVKDVSSRMKQANSLSTDHDCDMQQLKR